MTTKDYLRQIKTVDKRIDNKLEQVERLKSLRERVTTVLSDMPKGGGEQDRIAIITQRIFELIEEINEDTDRLVDIKRDVYNRIKAVQDDRYRTILESKYLCYQTWEQIAEDMNIEERWIYYLHGRALVEFANSAC